ncbi:MAG: ATP-binding protein [Planctomycetota bacterium]
MLIAIASGKGGTGKTTVAVNLALSAPGPVCLLDCDVEEPNCHIFIKAELGPPEPVTIPVPVVDGAKCTACGACSRICQYHAIVSLKTKALVFPEMCHGCGGCVKVCPAGAITESGHAIGVIVSGRSGGIDFTHGRLDVGHPMSPPLIRAVKRHAAAEGLTIIDCPPGTSCPVITALRDSDYVVLVTEPTPFGLHDLQLAVATVHALGIPCGVVINRSDAGDEGVLDYCRKTYLPVLHLIHEDRRIAEAYSRGVAVIDALPEYASAYARLWAMIDPVGRSV